MNRLTRAIVLVSTLAAAIIELHLATTPLLPFVFWFTIALAAAWFIAGHRVHMAGLPIVMFAMYVAPAAWIWFGLRPDYQLEMIWILPLFGLMASGRGGLEWSLPPSWRWPLIAWAIVVSVTWPIVLLRELDFYPTLMYFADVANSSEGIAPGEAAMGVAYFALGHNVGILWIDALFRWYSAERTTLFKAHVLYPLAGAAAMASALAIYQGFIDIYFLNTGFWGYMLRASGTLGDPNKLGMVAAFWAIGSVALGRGLASPWSGIVSFGGVFIALVGIWMTGTRTGLAAVLIGLTALGIEGFRHWRSTRATATVSMTRIAVVAAAVVVVAVATGLLLTQSRTHTVIGRGMLGYLPIVGDKGVVTGLNETLWERMGYGPAAILMLREHPIAGVGVGAYHTLVHDFGTLLGYDIVPDNAQNWFRHLIAELGMVGSVPWIWWCLAFAGLLFARGAGFTAGILRSALIGFAIASLFGMAGQSMAIIITFWTFVFWFAISTGAGREEIARSWRGGTIVATAVLVLLHAGVTFAEARGDLLPRNRAQRFGWPYSYGFYGLERDLNGGPGRRWTFERALTVLPVQGTTLKFVGWVDHPDADENPVHVRVWADGRLMHSGDLRRSASLVLDIPATPGAKTLMLETRVSRMWRPSDYGRGDRRRLGLSIRDWQWE